MIAPPDINLLPKIPCEYRLMHIASGRFVNGVSDGTVESLTPRWEDAMYFQSSDYEKGDAASALQFQWEWDRDQADMTWMHDANMNDYRVHVLIGESGY